MALSNNNNYNVNVFFSFDLLLKLALNINQSISLFMVYIPLCKQQLRTMKYYTQIRDIAHLHCSCITFREPFKNQPPRHDIPWLHVTNHLYY